MASKPELLHNQAADEIGQDFLLAYQRAVLLALQRQGFLNEMQYNATKRRSFYVTSSSVLSRIHG